MPWHSGRAYTPWEIDHKGIEKIGFMADLDSYSQRQEYAHRHGLFNTLNLVLNIHVHLAELLQLLGLGLPVSSAVSLEESCNKLAERVGVCLKQTLKAEKQ